MGPELQELTEDVLDAEGNVLRAQGDWVISVVVPKAEIERFRLLAKEPMLQKGPGSQRQRLSKESQEEFVRLKIISFTGEQVNLSIDAHKDSDEQHQKNTDSAVKVKSEEIEDLQERCTKLKTGRMVVKGALVV